MLVVVGPRPGLGDGATAGAYCPMDDGSRRTQGDTALAAEGTQRLAIGMPVRNGENYLAAALECLLSQTYRDFSLLISDNSSTDRTRELAEAAAARDPRVTYVRQEQNLGAAGNFNHVFRATRSEYFKWAAHDDLMDPTYLEKTVALLDASPGAVIAHSNSLLINSDGRRIGRYDSQATLLHSRPSVRLAASFRLDYPCAIWGVMRRGAIEQTRLHEGYLGSDWNFLGEMLLLGEVVLVPEYLFSVRSHEDAFSFGVQKQSKHFRLNWFDPNAKHPMKSAFRSAARFTQATIRHPLELHERVACLRAIAGRCLRKATVSVRRGLGVESARA